MGVQDSPIYGRREHHLQVGIQVDSMQNNPILIFLKNVDYSIHLLFWLIKYFGDAHCPDSTAIWLVLVLICSYAAYQLSA